jgi:hypothetical protein
VSTTVTVLAPFQVVLAGTVYTPGQSFDCDDDVAAHWTQHGWVAITATGAPSVSATTPNPTHHRHLGADTAPAPPPTGVDEVQQITINGNPAAGTFTLASSDAPTVTTAPIPAKPAPGQIETALGELASIGVGNVYVTQLDTWNFTVTFVGALAGTDVAQLLGDGTNLTPSGKTVTVTTVTAGGTGKRAAAKTRPHARR